MDRALRKLSSGSVLKSRPVRNYLLMTVGIVLVAYALNAFLIPNKIAAGGVSGLATIIYHVALERGITLPVGAQMLAINAVLLLLAFKARGWRFAAKTIYGTVVLSVLIDTTAPFVPTLVTDDLLLAALYGGAVAGLGLGMVFKAGGNTGGSDLVAQLVSRHIALGLGQLMLAIDAVVTVIAALVFGPELALYGAVAIFVTGSVIDLVLEGLSVNKMAYIISEHSDRIGTAILHDLGRGATALSARGLYSGSSREMIFTVVARNEIDQLKEIVMAIDPQALLIVSNVHEAIGEGFKEIGV